MIQKHILLVRNLKTKEDKTTIQDILDSAGIKGEVSLENKFVTIFSRGDAVAHAKRLISEKGFEII